MAVVSVGLAGAFLACDYGPEIPANTSNFAPSTGHTFGVVLDTGMARMANVQVLLGQTPSYQNIVDGGPEPALHTTNSQGFFEFQGFGRPTDAYDLTVRADVVRPRDLAFFQGVRRYNATYPMFANGPLRGWSGQLVVQVEPRPADSRVAFFVSGAPLLSSVPSGNGLAIVWWGTFQARADVHALSYREDPVTKLPREYLGYARGSVVLTNGEATAWNARLEPVHTSEVKLSLDQKNDAGDVFGDVHASVTLDLGDSRSRLEIARPATGATTFTAPELDGSRIILRGQASSDGGISRIVRYVDRYAETSPIIAFERPRRLDDAPPEGASISAMSTFRWPGSRASRLVVDAGEVGRIALVTGTGEVTIPWSTLEILGLLRPTETVPATITLHSYPRFRDTDALVTPFIDFDFEDSTESAPIHVNLVP